MLIEIEGPRSTPEIALVDRSTLKVLAAPQVTTEAIQAIASASLAAERTLGVPVDVEWVLPHDPQEPPWLVQARPLAIQEAAEVPRFVDATGRDPLEFSREEPDALWTWDAAHNPEPLSPAQEGLVELVDSARAAPVRQRVVVGYLYTTPHGARGPAIEISPPELGRVHAEEIVPAMEGSLAPLERMIQVGSKDLEAALAAYVDFYRTYAGILSPALSKARALLPDFLGSRLGPAEAMVASARLLGKHAVSPLDRLLWAVARGGANRAELLALAAPMSPAWDVSVPTFGEDPSPLDEALRLLGTREPPLAALEELANEEEARIRALLSHGERQALGELVGILRHAARIGEEDDVYFARAQAGVRGVLASIARGWSLDLGVVVNLPLVEIRAAARTGVAPVDAERRASVQKAETERRRRLLPPLHILGGEAIHVPSSTSFAPGILRGRGVGGRAQGRIVRCDADRLRAPRPPDAVLVTRTITPAMAPLLVGARAVISEHGGLLGHGAALARELGIPCVVGCTGALGLPEGARAWVDGVAGLVILQ